MRNDPSRSGSVFEELSEEEREVVLYGRRSLVTALITIVIILFLSASLGIIYESTWLILFLIPFRLLFGSFHLRNRWSCMIASTGLILAITYVSREFRFELMYLLPITVLLLMFQLMNTEKTTKFDTKKAYTIGISILIVWVLIPSQYYYLLATASLLTWLDSVTAKMKKCY